MRFLGLLFFLFSSVSFAQVVTSVQGAEANVNLQGLVVKAGDRVQFLDSKLDVAGEGTVVRVSSGGSRALVKIVSGKVSQGMSFEKFQVVEAIAMPVTRTKRVSSAGLSDEDRRVLQIGEISQTRYIVGGILATYPLGFGIGHAVQGRYSDKGWIFTAGELASIAVMFAGFGDCSYSSNRYESCSGGLVVLGAFAFVGFRIWEAIDAWAVPPEHNRRYREIIAREPASEVTFQPGIVPLADGGMLGLRVTF